jgi:hypothetical protein
MISCLKAFLDETSRVGFMFYFKSEGFVGFLFLVRALCRIWCTFSTLLLKIFAILPVVNVDMR